LRRATNRLVHALHDWVARAGAIQPGTELAESVGAFGPGSYVAFPMATLYGAGSIHIGRDTLIGRSCSLLVGYATEDPHVPERGIVIGAGSWIGHGAIILPGTHLGRHVVVGAGSVVRGRVPDHCVVAGAPPEPYAVSSPAGAGSRPTTVRTSVRRGPPPRWLRSSPARP